MSGRGKGRKRHGEGSFHTQKRDLVDITFQDFKNPWTFANLCRSDDEDFFKWLRDNGLLPNDVKCGKCNKTAVLYRRQKTTDGYSLRCPGGHEYSMRKFSFFQGSSYNIRDILLFINCYLVGEALHQCSISSGLEYKTTSVNWASYIRELFVQYVYEDMSEMKFEDEVEIDESLFGRKIKYNKGKPTGHRIWIFGIVERSTNRIILYPVDCRNAATLIPIIKKHVLPGTKIFSDTWAAYLELNNAGYTHFSVTHKSTFRQTYKNVETGEIVQCNTNRIEGTWKICKDHFRRINGSNTRMFEQRLSEIIWRNHVHRTENIYQSFYSLLKRFFTLTSEPNYTYTKPLFNTWTPPTADVEEQHRITIVQSSDNDSDGEIEIENRGALGDVVMSGATGSVTSSTVSGATVKSVSASVTVRNSGAEGGIQSSEDDSEVERMKLFFPKGYKPLNQSTAKKEKRTVAKRRVSNPYAKSAFVFDFSSSDDDLK